MAGDFYVLVEPHNNGRQSLIETDHIDQWWRARNSYVADRDWVDEALSHAPKGSAAIYDDRERVIEALASVRARLSGEVAGSGQCCVDEITKTYSNILKNNSIGDVHNAFPAGFAEIYAAEPTRKLTEDDMRYWLHCSLEIIYSRYNAQNSLDLQSLGHIFNRVGDAMKDMKPIVNNPLIRSMIAPTDQISECGIFVRSSFFMAIPLLKKETMGLSTNETLFKQPAHHEMFLNAAALQAARHDRILSNSVGTAANIVKILKARGIQLSPEQLEQLSQK
jgi:hypothetical protein